MGKSRIMWNNIVPSMDIYASATDSGYPVNNVATWRELSIWTASGEEEYELLFEINDSGSSSPPGVDTLVLMAHNLASCGARYKLEGSDDPDSSEWTDSSSWEWASILAYQTPGDDYCKAHQFTEKHYLAYKLTINKDGGGVFSPQIGIVFLGKYLEIPRNPDPNGIDPDACEEIKDSQVSESGILLGESIPFTKRNPSFSYPYLDPDFIKDEWIPFRQNHRGLPFFWMWDSAKPSETYLMKFASTTITQPYNQILYRSLQFDLEGRKEQ